MNIKSIGNFEFEETVLNSKKLTIVDFYADWCGPCKMLTPVLEEITEEFLEDIDIYKVDIEENRALTLEYSVLSIPTLIIFKNGEEIKTLKGYRPKDELIKEIKGLI